MRPALRLLTTALLALLLAYAVPPLKRRCTVLGLFPFRRPLASPTPALLTIPNTQHCEDLHHLPGTTLLFTACEDSTATRFSWFPPLANFDDAAASLRGGLHVIDATTLTARRLRLADFPGPFATHGIDVLRDPAAPDAAVFIFAVNHLPHPSFGSDAAAPRARSQIEIFHHRLHSDSAEHVRTVRHPLISTPNDIYAVAPGEFYVTNDHYYRSGAARLVEDLVPVATWSTVVHVQVHELSSDDPEGGVTAVVALKGLHNANGLGHVRDAAGKDAGELLITSAASGVLHRASRTAGSHNLEVLEEIGVDSTLDNPSYYADPYPEIGGPDASGYILCGLTRALDFAAHVRVPGAKDAAVVWHVTRAASGGWAKRVIFEDDGEGVRAATTAVLVPIDPASEGGRKRGWLFVTSLWAEGVVVVKVDVGV